MTSLPPQVTPSPSVRLESKRIDKELPQVIVDAIKETIEREDHVGSWMTDAVLRVHLKRRYNFGEDLDFTTRRLNHAISKHFHGVGGSDHTTNQSGLYRLEKATNRNRHVLYQFAKPGTPFKGTPPNMDTAAWAALITLASDHHESLPGACSGALTRQAAKRQRVQTDVDITLQSLHAELKVEKAMAQGAKRPPPTFVCPGAFEDTRIRNLFRCKPEESVEDTLERRLKLLGNCVNEPRGYCQVLPEPGDPDGLHTDREILNLRHRSQALYMAHTIALEQMPNGASWNSCCEEAVATLRNAGVKTCTARTVERYNQQFRVGDCFKHINVCVATGIKPEPLVFELFPEAKGRLICWAVANIKTLSIESIKKYFESILFPSLLEQMNEDIFDDDEKLTLVDFYKMLGFSSTSLSDSTVCRYLKALKFDFKARGKTNYVDGHESDDVIKDRLRFCHDYIKLELRCHRWVQVDPNDETIQQLLDDKALRRDEAYSYRNAVGEERLEFHVDSAKELTDFINGDYCKQVGGNLSVRMKPCERPVMVWGQDEALYYQYAVRRKQWYLPDGGSELRPKSDGDAIMASLFINREDGLLDWTNDLAVKVNALHKGKECISWC